MPWMQNNFDVCMQSCLKNFMHAIDARATCK